MNMTWCLHSVWNTFEPELTVKESSFAQAVWKKVEIRHGFNMSLKVTVVPGFSEGISQRSIGHTYLGRPPAVIPGLISRPLKCAVAGCSGFPLGQWLWKEERETVIKGTGIVVWCGSNSYLRGLVLHSSVGFAADVTGYHPQAVGLDACYHRNQIDLEPQLVVFYFKDDKFRSKAAQSQV